MTDPTTPQTPPADEGEQEAIKCRYCWRDMPADAHACPHCGIARHQDHPVAPTPAQEPKRKLGCLGAVVAGLILAVLLFTLG